MKQPRGKTRKKNPPAENLVPKIQNLHHQKSRLSLSLSLSLSVKITQPAKDHRENGAPQELERDLQLLMCGFYIPSASGRGDIAKLFLQEECARRQRPAKKSAVTRRRQRWERRGEGRGWDGEWMKTPQQLCWMIYSG
jgi:hypothetical protein